MIFSDASDGDVIILPQSDHDGHYYLLKEPENELELLDFMQAIKDGKAERHGTSAIGRFTCSETRDPGCPEFHQKWNSHAFHGLHLKITLA